MTTTTEKEEKNAQSDMTTKYDQKQHILLDKTVQLVTKHQDNQASVERTQFN
jgi:hypothetical protein